MLRSGCIWLALSVLGPVAMADEVKRDIQGVSLGMSMDDAVHAAPQACNLSTQNKGYVVCGGGSYNAAEMNISVSRNLKPRVVDQIHLSFCSKGTLKQVAAALAKTYHYSGQPRPIEEKVLGFEVGDERVVVAQMSPCDNGQGSKFLMGLTDLKILTEDRRTDTSDPGQVIPKL